MQGQSIKTCTTLSRWIMLRLSLPIRLGSPAMSTCFLLNSVRDTGTNGYSDCYITRHSLAQILVMFAFESFVTCLEEYFVNCWHY
ncbi:hypothetical protein GBAR_LOCUS24777, partial [Geodia barretti]